GLAVSDVLAGSARIGANDGASARERLEDYVACRFHHRGVDEQIGGREVIADPLAADRTGESHAIRHREGRSLTSEGVALGPLAADHEGPRPIAEPRQRVEHEAQIL